MNIINIFDTSVGTQNIGDEIIVDAVTKELREIFFKDTMFVSSPTHEIIGITTYRLVKASRASFVAGTCLLNSKPHILRRGNWKINLFDTLNFKNVILMGVGWGAYQNDPNFIAKVLYNSALSKDYIHSVRDNYTKAKLQAIGIDNVINTGCPTMWKLTENHCKEIPHSKADNVVVTLTDYNRDPVRDKKLLQILSKNYNKVYFWIQGIKDYDYFKSIYDPSKVSIISPSLKDYDMLLESDEDLDFVGTRLHAGIRAMQKKRRSIILGIDNRALEKKKDFNLNVINRKDIDGLEDYLNSNIITEIKLDLNAIETWKNQFKDFIG